MCWQRRGNKREFLFRPVIYFMQMPTHSNANKSRGTNTENAWRKNYIQQKQDGSIYSLCVMKYW